jgi:cell division septal protein FtsQ
MQKRNVLNSPRLLELKKHRQRVVLNKILIFLLGLLAIFLSLVFISRLKAVNISDIEIIGNKIVDADAIKADVQGELAGKYLWLFPKSNVLIYPENAIKNELQNKFARLKDINLSLKNNSILEISVSERMPEYLWCGTVPAPSDELCYFMDVDGYIFDTAPYFSGEVYFKFYGENISLGSYFSKQNFKQLISFRDILVSLGLKPVALYTTTDGDIQIFLSGGISLSDAPKILFRADADFGNIAENLQAALNTEPLLSKFKNNYSKLQYIDLRFGNKVYDKFSN